MIQEYAFTPHMPFHFLLKEKQTFLDFKNTYRNKHHVPKDAHTCQLSLFAGDFPPRKLPNGNFEIAILSTILNKIVNFTVFTDAL